MVISRLKIGTAIALACLAGVLLFQACGLTVPPPLPPVDGCNQQCGYQEICQAGDEGCNLWNGEDHTYLMRYCATEAACQTIYDVRNRKKKINGHEYSEYRFENWDDQQKKCKSSADRKKFPEGIGNSCTPLSGKMCNVVPKSCSCDQSKDMDCDEVLDGEDKCMDITSNFLLEDKEYDEFLNDGCADIDNDEDGICDPWVVATHQEDKFFTSRGCQGGIGVCCKDGADLCKDLPCLDNDQSGRCTNTSHPHYGCKSDFELIPVGSFAAPVTMTMGSQGSAYVAVARFLSFGSNVAAFPKFNEVTLKISYKEEFKYAKDLRVRWTVASDNAGDAPPQLDPSSGETGWDAAGGNPQEMKLKFVEQKPSPRNHPLKFTIKAEIINLDLYVNGKYTVTPLTITQTGADQCVQKGLDGGTESDYDKCRYEGMEIRGMAFTSDHQDANGDNLLKSGDAEELWEIGDPFNTKTDPQEFLFDGSRNNPISHSYGEKLQVRMDIRGMTTGDRYTITGTGDNPYTTFTASGNWNGSLAVSANAALPFKLGILEEHVEWVLKVFDKSNQEIASRALTSGPHKIYVTFDKPIETTTLFRDYESQPEWLLPPYKAKLWLSTNKITDKKLDILLAPYNLTGYGIAGGLGDVPEIVKATHDFLNSAPIILESGKPPEPPAPGQPPPKSCFAAEHKPEYMWTAFSLEYSLRCFERAFLMEIFLGAMGIEAKAVQIKASNTPDFPVEYMVMTPPVVYRSRSGPPKEWLLMDFAPPPGQSINIGEGATLVDLSQGVGTKDERYYPHAVAEGDGQETLRASLVAKTPCGIMKRLKTGIPENPEFQRWCQASSPVVPWVCSDRVPVPSCTE